MSRTIYDENLFDGYDEWLFSGYDEYCESYDDDNYSSTLNTHQLLESYARYKETGEW
jgi:hypothetical protein